MGFQFLGHEIHLRLAVQYISHLTWFPLRGQAPYQILRRRCCDPMAIRTVVLALNLPVLNFHALLVTLNHEKLSYLLRL